MHKLADPATGICFGLLILAGRLVIFFFRFRFRLIRGRWQRLLWRCYLLGIGRPGGLGHFFLRCQRICGVLRHHRCGGGAWSYSPAGFSGNKGLRITYQRIVWRERLAGDFSSRKFWGRRANRCQRTSWSQRCRSCSQMGSRRSAPRYWRPPGPSFPWRLRAG